MRRDYFTLELHEVGGEEANGEIPTVHVAFDGPSEVLEERLDALTEGREEGVDVAFRLKDPIDEPDAAGVFAVTDRLTGDFVLEVNATAEDVLDLIAAARESDYSADDSDHYYFRLTHGDEDLVATEKRTLLVYDPEGDLMRQHSLIPGGVEL